MKTIIKKSRAGRKPKPEAERKSHSYLIRVKPVHSDYLMQIAVETSKKPVDIIRQIIDEAYQAGNRITA